MAARKENSVPIACQAPNGRITRAQAAANRRSFPSFPSIPLHAKAEQKQAAQGKTKRGSSYETTSSSAAISGPQPKRRTVLRDVTNVSRANSNKNTAATKLQVLRCSTHNSFSTWSSQFQQFPKHLCKHSRVTGWLLFFSDKALPKGWKNDEQKQAVCKKGS